MGLFNFNLTTAHYTRDKKTKEKLVFFFKATVYDVHHFT